MSLEINGQVLDTDPEGYLCSLADWNEHVAELMAQHDEIQLDGNHWEVIHFLREYYDEYQLAPAMRILAKAMAKKLGRDKGNTRYLYQLFPAGPAKQACKYAGLPKPTGCV